MRAQETSTSSVRHHPGWASKQQKQAHKNKVDRTGRSPNYEAARITPSHVKDDSALISTNGVPESREGEDDAHESTAAGRGRQRARRYE